MNKSFDISKGRIHHENTEIPFPERRLLGIIATVFQKEPIDVKTYLQPIHSVKKNKVPTK